MIKENQITYSSLCTGISCESIAVCKPYSDILDWKPLFFAEIDEFCRQLLKEKYPHVKLYSDINNLRSGEITERPDVLIAGTPCQSFSINAGRKGLSDSRGQLSLTFVQIVQYLNPSWVIWENVPNCLKIDRGHAFYCILNSLERIGYGLAWRIFNLQDFGYPQKRKRLFLVGHRTNSKFAFASLVERSQSKPNENEIKRVQKKDMERTLIDGWTDDSTPKRSIDSALTLKGLQGRNGCGVIYNGYKGMIRKFTCLEMERLQGIPDNYTKLNNYSGIDSKRQRSIAIGNSFPPPIIKWICNRIDFIESVIRSK